MPTSLQSPALSANVPTRPAWSSMLALRNRLAVHDGYLALFAYLLIASIWYRSVLLHMSSHCACGVTVDTGDNSDFVWWFEWFVHALGSGLPLFHTTVIWTPTGINLAGTTTPVLLAIAAAPFTLLWGPLPAYNVVMIVAPVASGWAANRLCRHVSGAAWPALLAGAAFGFSSYEVAHLIGQPHLVVMVCPPLVALCAIRLLDGTLSRRRYVVYTSLLLIAQILISVEVLFTGTIVGFLALLAAAATGTATQRHDLRARLSALALPWLIAGVATLWYTAQVLGASDYAAGVTSRYPTDLLAFLIPAPYTWLGGSAFASLSSHLSGTWIETSPYLGWPLILILGHYLVTARRTRAAQILLIVVALVSLLVLGPILYVDGQAVLRLPAAIISGLPLFDKALFGRMSVYLALAASVALALWLARPRRSRLVSSFAGVLAVAAVLPNLATPGVRSVGTWTKPRFFFSPQYKRYLRPGETILPIPWGYSGQSMMWQAQDHMYWRMANGLWVFVPPPQWVNNATADLWNNVPPRAGDGPILRRLLLSHDVSDVVVLGAYVPRWHSTLLAAGLRPVAAVGGVALYST